MVGGLEAGSSICGLQGPEEDKWVGSQSSEPSRLSGFGFRV